MRHRRPAILALAAVILTVTAAGCATGPDDLTASNPPGQAALATAPPAVELTFSAPPTVDLSHISVLDESGRIVNSGALTRHGTGTLRQPVAIQAPGILTVAYHVIFADGTDTQGSMRFSVGTGTAPPPLNAAPAAHAEHTVDPLSAVLLIVDAIVVLTVAVLLLRRPRILPAAEHRTDGEDD
jgi:methionine-rich copper-binding protein CopC